MCIYLDSGCYVINFAAVVGHRLSIISVISSTIVILGWMELHTFQNVLVKQVLHFFWGLKYRKYFYPWQSTVPASETSTGEVRLKFGPKEKINWIKPNLPLTTLRGFGSGKSIKLNSLPLRLCHGTILNVMILSVPSS